MIIDRIYEMARSQPNKLALIHDDFVIDYATFAKGIETFRKILQQQELPAGATAVVLVSHLADAWALVLALRALGLTTIQLQSLSHAKALKIKNVTCVVTTEREQSAHDLAGNAFGDAKIIVVLRSELAATQTGDVPNSLQRDRPFGGHILHTSGTTDTSKQVMWDSQLEDARVSALSRSHGYDNVSVAHVLNYELGTAVGWKFPLSVWLAGGCVIIDQRPERYERFFRHPITHSRMTPNAFRYLVTMSDFNLHVPIGCEIWIGGGVMGELASKAIEKFGHAIRLYHHYGATELTIPPLTSRLQKLEDALWLCPAPDRTIQIVDESGHECLPGQDGDLGIHTTELDWQCYLDDEEATSKAFRNGFFYSGDRAVRHVDGRIRILGRVADVINYQGEKIAVAPLELRIQQFLQIDDVCVFSGLNDAGQEELVIAVESDNRPPEQKLDSIIRDFGEFDRVRFSVLRKFPRTEAGTGKIRRAALRKLVFSESDNRC